MATRINPSTGVVEEANTLQEVCNAWQPRENENGNTERVNPSTGVVEEANLLQQVCNVWTPKE